MDVEGGEERALEGMKELSHRNPQLQLIMELDWGNLQRAGPQAKPSFESSPSLASLAVTSSSKASDRLLSPEPSRKRRSRITYYSRKSEIMRRVSQLFHLRPTPATSTVSKARRPVFSALTSSRLPTTRLPRLRSWQEALSDYLQVRAARIVT